MSQVSVEDRVLIRELYDTFYFALNDGDPDTMLASFAPGGIVTRYSGDADGPEFGAATSLKWAADPVGKTYQHHVTNLVVKPDPDGRDDFRAVRMYFLITGVWEPPHVIVRWSCEANDMVQQIDGRWVFSERSITLNHDATGEHWSNEPLHPDAAEVAATIG